MPNVPESSKRITGHTLKVIACITMLIDHCAAGILFFVVRAGKYPDTITFDQMKLFYDILRGIGRNAFPIFCFLLVEGFIHTSNRLRYALSLLIFGFISEPFFDVTFYAKEEIFNGNLIECLKANTAYLNDHCNVYFTLFIGLIVIWVTEQVLNMAKDMKIPLELAYVFSGVILMGGIFAAEKLHTDYHGFGIGMIFAFYLFKYQSPIDLIVAFTVISLLKGEYRALPCFILMYFYNHKRGRKIGNFKYLFYAFYPVHIFLIYLARCYFFG